jgi:hypothetical protein
MFNASARLWAQAFGVDLGQIRHRMDCTNLDAIAKCLPARPVGTTPIVAWHEVPGKASLERSVP